MSISLGCGAIKISKCLSVPLERPLGRKLIKNFQICIHQSHEDHQRAVKSASP